MTHEDIGPVDLNGRAAGVLIPCPVRRRTRVRVIMECIRSSKRMKQVQAASRPPIRRGFPKGFSTPQ